MTPPRNVKRKLIEVGLPLLEINAACKEEKARTHGTIRNIHKWFAPMPVPAWRALIFAALVDDPVDEERRLYYLDVTRRLVKNGGELPDLADLREAQLILEAQFPEGVPTVMDPFCGGGSTLVEGQRLGLPTLGSDLNPVPVLITRVMTEILPKVWDHQPLQPNSAHKDHSPATHGRGAGEDDSLFKNVGAARTYRGYEGLIAEVALQAEQIRDAVAIKTSRYFPSTPGENVVAWYWARTARCPNPACRIETILATSWCLSKTKGHLAWITPHVEGAEIKLEITSNQVRGNAPVSAKVGRGDFSCISCGTTLKADYLRTQGKAGHLGLRMLAIATERDGRRIYRAPRADETAAALDCPRPELSATPIQGSSQYMGARSYGMNNWEDLYTNRQLCLLAAFSDAVAETHRSLVSAGASSEWSSAVAAMLGLAVGRLAANCSSQSRLRLSDRQQTKTESAFGRPDLPMMWDFSEVNVFGGGVGDWMAAAMKGTKVLSLIGNGSARGEVQRSDARVVKSSKPALLATDPPYFDAIPYADLSDYFYMWHRRALSEVFPDLYTSMSTPKMGELTAIQSHHGGDAEKAKAYFVDGFTQTFVNLQSSMAPDLPGIVVYASKEQKDSGSEQTRWASVLTSMIASGLEITGTWPIHGTGSTRMRGMESNAVATYIAMVARPRPAESQPASWADFARELRVELPAAIHDLQVSAVLPVDMPQAVMGPGMRIFSRYPAVLRGDGSSMTVDQAITEINRVREEIMDAAEGELDRDSQCALSFWTRHGWKDAPFGEADEIVRPRGRTVDDLLRAQVLVTEQGRARVLGAPGSLDRLWDPTADQRPTAWEGVHHVAERLASSDLGVPGTAALYGQLQSAGIADATRALAYRLAGLSAKLGRSSDEQRYNDVIEAWPLLATASMEPTTDGLF